MAVSITNYYIGTGIISWQPLGVTGYNDLGNAPVFEFDPKNTPIAHYSSRLGVKFKDDQRIIAIEPEVNFTLDEHTQSNLALNLLGSTVASVVNIMDIGDVRGSLRFVGANRVGPQKTIVLPNVVLTPTSKLSFIDASKYGEIMFMGFVLGDPLSGSFGTIADTSPGGPHL